MTKEQFEDIVRNCRKSWLDGFDNWTNSDFLLADFLSNFTVVVPVVKLSKKVLMKFLYLFFLRLKKSGQSMRLGLQRVSFHCIACSALFKDLGCFTDLVCSFTESFENQVTKSCEC